MTEVWRLGVGELVASIREGDVTIREVVEAFIERGRRVDAVVNAFIEREDDATARVAAVERWPDAPLRGVPYAYKDVFAHDGASPTVGVRDIRLELRSRRATVLDRLDAAGAVALGRLNLDPFAYTATGANPDFGDTRNPWDRTRIAGGSSSGAAAAVAAGAVPFAIGTDSGGSLRIPAALCGVTALKPTLGRIPKTGSAPLTYSQDTVGILARSARDISIVLEHVAGHDPTDAASISAPVPRASDLRAAAVGVRVGYDPRAFGERTTPDIAAAAAAALGVLGSHGAEPVEVDLSAVEAYDAAATVLTWAEAGAAHERTFRADPDAYPRAIRDRLELALAVHGADHVDAMRLQGRALDELVEGPLASADVFLAPTVGAPAVSISSSEREVVGASVRNLRLNRPFNFTGVPSLAVPVGFSDDGLPLGVQLVGRPWHEPTLLACAAAYQDATDWHSPFPPLAQAD